nr:MAG TPA: hypothetical protein [Caudoviricetes sp.]
MSLAYVYARGRCILFILLYFVHFFPKKYVLSGIFFRRNVFQVGFLPKK